MLIKFVDVTSVGTKCCKGVDAVSLETESYWNMDAEKSETGSGPDKRNLSPV
jgi:hypothetical protein